MSADQICRVCEQPIPERLAVDTGGRPLCGRPACVGARRRLPLRQRLFAHVEQSESCWLWTGTKNGSGAGVLHIRENGRVRQVVAPRLAWELHFGPIPANHRVWHRCWEPACIRPDHLFLRRRRTGARTPAPSHPATPAASTRLGTPRRFASGALEGHRTWWTRERVLDGLRRFYDQTVQAPVTSILWDQVASNRGRRRQTWRRRFPSSYGVLRYFPSFRTAWEAAGVQLANRRQAPWASIEDWYVTEAIGVLPTATIALDLGRTESAIYRRIRHLQRHITDARGWPLQRVVRITGVSEHSLRGYIRRGELPAFKGAKCVYIDPGDLPVVDEIDWNEPHPDLELAVLSSLRGRLVQVLAARDWRRIRADRAVPASHRVLYERPRLAQRPPCPSWIAPGVRVSVLGPTPAMPQRTVRIGVVERVYWSANSRQVGPAQWRARVVFPRAYRKSLGATVAYCLPASTLRYVARPDGFGPSIKPSTMDLSAG
jgi:hypothetical protein